MISASVGVNSSLLLEPAQTVEFVIDQATSSPTTPVDAGARTYLTLTNISSRKPVIFKVRTTKVDMFMVKPAQGIIPPDSEQTIIVTLVPSSSARLLAMAPRDRDAVIERFLIQSFDMGDDMRGFNVDDLSASWKKIPKEVITNKKLTCRFIEASSTAADRLVLPFHRMRLLQQSPAEETNFNANQNPNQNNHAQQQPYRPQPLLSPAIDQKSFHRSRLSPHRPEPQKEVMPSFKLLRSQHRASGGYTSPSIPASPGHHHDNYHGYTASNTSSHTSSRDGRDDTYAGGSGSGNGSGSGSRGAAVLVTTATNDSYATDQSGRMSYDELIMPDDVREYRLHPSDSLTFSVRRMDTGYVEGMSYFLLTNRARYSGLAFKVKTSNYSGYFVKPARGLIAPTSAQRIDVTVNDPDAAPFNADEREMKDRFLVEVLFLDLAVYNKVAALEEEDQKREQMQKLWDKSDAMDREKSILTCQIVDEDLQVDPTYQTAEQARAMLHKSQLMNHQGAGGGGGRARGSSGGDSAQYYYQQQQQQQQQQPTMVASSVHGPLPPAAPLSPLGHPRRVAAGAAAGYPPHYPQQQQQYYPQQRQQQQQHNGGGGGGYYPQTPSPVRQQPSPSRGPANSNNNYTPFVHQRGVAREQNNNSTTDTIYV